MGLAGSQALLARLSTDAAFRRRFLDDPSACAAEFGIDPAEALEYASLLPGPIARFAGSLIGKRRGEVESLLPLTVRSLGAERFVTLFRRHASIYVPSGIKKHREDALAFARLVALQVDEPAWLGDLARIESAALSSHDPARRLLVVRLRFHPADLVRASAGDPIVARPTLVVWVRPTPRGQLWRWILTPPWSPRRRPV